MKTYAIIPSGGVGKRLDSSLPKQYVKVNGKEVIAYTLEIFQKCELIDEIIIPAQPEFYSIIEKIKTTYNISKLSKIIEGGKERQDSVFNALKAIDANDNDIIAVHDAARPCVRDADIKRLVDSVIGHADGGILALPLSDTIKRGGRNSAASVILETVPREGLWRAMTPQLFKVGELLSAILQARVNGVSLTDEASAMEETAAKIVLVPCSPDNIKITLPQDIQFAEMILRAQQHEANDLPE
jgi:2-C-methyl-D-erythritol 4-phosphate cytidylyltransferase